MGWGDTRKHRTAVATATVLPTGARRAPGAGAAADDDGAEHAGDELVFEVMPNITNVSCR